MPASIAVLRHVPHEHVGLIGQAFQDAGLGFAYTDTASPAAAWPSVASFRALVVMGGPMGVYEQERYPFLSREIALIRETIAAGKPVLGVCLGSQLIAAALGARVYPNGAKEIGWCEVDLTDAGAADPLFGGLPRRFVTFQWHGDTFDLPEGAVHLASAPLCRNQAIRFGDRVYGLQFHPEVDGAMVEEWLAEPGGREELARFDLQAERRIREGIARHEAGQRALSGSLFARFAALCR